MLSFSEKKSEPFISTKRKIKSAMNGVTCFPEYFSGTQNMSYGMKIGVKFRSASNKRILAYVNVEREN
jgi:hypothetical protein